MQSGKPRYMAGLREEDMKAGVMWLPVPGRSDLPDPKTLNGREVMRAPSRSWMALVGPNKQGIYLGGEKKEPRCAPAVDNGKAWSRTQTAGGLKWSITRSFPTNSAWRSLPSSAKYVSPSTGILIMWSLECIRSNPISWDINTLGQLIDILSRKAGKGMCS